MKYKCSVAIVFAALLIIFATYFFPSLKMESSENRTMATFDMIFHPDEESVVYHESIVERLDAALSDQFAYREAVVKRYLSLFNTLENRTYDFVRLFKKKTEGQYFLRAVGDYELIEDTGYLTEFPPVKPMNVYNVRKRVDEIERIHELFPGIKTYAYYVTQAYDTDWFNDYLGTTPVDHYKELTEAVPSYVKTGRLTYTDPADYMNLHFKTDHHWNHRGAQRGYEDLYAMLSDDFDLSPMLTPTEENDVSETYDFTYLGSYGRALGELYKYGRDDFSFYEYPFPERETAVIDPETGEEIPVAKVGLYDEYKAGEIDKNVSADHYIKMYGTARDADGKAYTDGNYPFVIRSNTGSGKNLLLLSDSYGRAIRDQLASHFDTLIYYDYRVPSKIPIDRLIEKYDIDALVICSNTGPWGAGGYRFVFEEDR